MRATDIIIKEFSYLPASGKLRKVINTADSDETQPLIPFAQDEIDNKIDFKLYKSLSYLNNMEFIEQDDDGLKMRLKGEFFQGDFPFEVGYVVISEYDDRQFLVSKIDPRNGFLWFGLWEE